MSSVPLRESGGRIRHGDPNPYVRDVAGHARANGPAGVNAGLRVTHVTAGSCHPHSRSRTFPHKVEPTDDQSAIRQA